jgi:hypothetical protein
VSEDEKILQFIANNRRYSDTKGNKVWKQLEQRNFVPGRYVRDRVTRLDDL